MSVHVHEEVPGQTGCGEDTVSNLHGKMVSLILVAFHWVPFLPSETQLGNTFPYPISVEGAKETYLRRIWLFGGAFEANYSISAFGDPAATARVPSCTTRLFSSWHLSVQRKERKGGKRDLCTQKTFNKSPQLCFLHYVHTNTHGMRIFLAHNTTGISCSCTVCTDQHRGVFKLCFFT